MLDISLKIEWILGKEELPAYVQIHFPHTLMDLMEQALPAKKHWFTLVRAHRETIGNGITDDFTSPKSQLRKWVGRKKREGTIETKVGPCITVQRNTLP